MRLLRVTYTLVVDIEPAGLDDDIAEMQRAIEMVCDEPAAYADEDAKRITVKWVDV